MIAALHRSPFVRRVGVAVGAALVALCLVYASAAPAAAVPPQVLLFTQAPSQQPDSISVKITIDPEGRATTFVLHYGATQALGASTARQSVGSGNGPVTVTATIGGLVAGQSYYVELVVTSSAGSNDAGPSRFVAGSTGGGSTVPSPPPPGKRWQKVDVVGAGRGGGGLAAVSCRGTACVAVGTDAKGPVAYRLRGSRLVPDTVRGLSNVLALDGISCWKATACMAVGSDGTTNGNAAALLSGRRWHTEAVPSPKSVGLDELMSVSCLSGRDCWAVGVMNGSTSKLVTLVEHWNGRSWSVTAAPRPSGSYLDAVSCVSPRDCWAAGFVRDNAPDTGPLAEHWNGHRWTVVHVVSGHNGFTGISCVAGRKCIVVGGTTPAAFELAGTKWHRIPPTQMNGAFGQLACASANACWAIGLATLSKPAAWQWDGSTWTATAAPARGPAELSGIACLSATRCLAVGAKGVGAGGGPGKARPLALLTPKG